MSRGTLRIYLGAAPGVGKTYAMLNEGRRRQARGEDVVVAFVESHGRQRTADQVGDLEVLPRAPIAYRDAVFEEMDLDALLERRPQLALVDELAHTNVPGCRNAKRWQDVEELLDAGISVISNLNIQHLESLNDVVEEITGVTQRETIPDEIVRRADQLQLVDLAVETIRARLSRGDIYPAERIDAALGNYFRAGNLAALRELALLWIADRVEEGLEEYRVRHGISDTWETRERVLVALSGSADGDRLVRRAARMAQRFNADLIAVHVRPQTGLVSAAADLLEQQGRLVEQFGGTYREVAGADIGETLVETARLVNATQIVLGARERPLWKEYIQGSVVEDVIRRSGVGLDVHVISRPADAPSSRETAPRLRHPRSLPRRRVALGFLLAGIGAPLLTLALSEARDQVSPSSALLLFLLLVVCVSAVGGLWPALVVAIGGFLLVNWYLTPPLHTWTVSDPEHVLALVVFLAVAMAMSSFVALAARRASQATRARAKAETLMRLAGTSSASTVLDSLCRAFDFDGAALLHRHDGGWCVEAASGAAPSSVEDAGFTLDVDAEHVLVARPRPADINEDARMLEAFAKELAASVEHGELEAEAATAEELAAAIELRESLLSSVSHDLRTPLAAIKASVTSLLQDDVAWTQEAEDELLTTIDEEADRLDRLVGSLLDMSRLQAGAVDVHRELVLLDEVVAQSLASIGVRSGQVVLDLSESLPPVYADEALLERALANVVANAVAYSGDDRPRIVAGAVHDSVDVRVIDHGPGVPDEDRDGIFQPFRRLGDSRRREGVGLGLAIAKGFVEAMGGTIEAEDYPRRRSDHRDPTGDEAVTRVLVVDDEPQILRALSINLRARGYEVDLAENGESALRQAAHEHPDVVDPGLGIAGNRRARGDRGPARLELGADRRALGPRPRARQGGGARRRRRRLCDQALRHGRAARAHEGRHASRRSRAEAAVVETRDFTIDMAARTVVRDGDRGAPHGDRMADRRDAGPKRRPAGDAAPAAAGGVGSQYEHETHYLRVYMGQIRRKLEPVPSEPRYFLTAPRMGYRFELEPRA